MLLLPCFHYHFFVIILFLGRGKSAPLGRIFWIGFAFVLVIYPLPLLLLLLLLLPQLFARQAFAALITDGHDSYQAEDADKQDGTLSRHFVDRFECASRSIRGMYEKCPASLRDHLRRAFGAAEAEASDPLAPVIVHALVGELVSAVYIPTHSLTPHGHKQGFSCSSSLLSSSFAAHGILVRAVHKNNNKYVGARCSSVPQLSHAMLAWCRP